MRPWPPLARCWMAAFGLISLLAAGACARNVQKTGNLPEPADPSLAVDWTYLHPPPEAEHFPLRSIQFLDSNHGWAIDRGGNLIATSDGGSNWRQASDLQRLIDVHFVDLAMGWAVTVGNEAPFFSTETGGRSWVPSTGAGGRAVHFVDRQIGWVVGSDGEVFKTENGGRQWSPQFSGVEETLLDVTFLDRKTGWATGGEDVILATKDGGAHWALQKTERRKDTRLLTIAFATPRTGWAAGQRDSQALLLKTNDGGKTWLVDDRITFRGELLSATVAPSGRILLAGRSSRSPVLIEGRVIGKSPSVQNLQVEDQLDDSVLLSLRARDEHPAAVTLSSLEFRRPDLAVGWILVTSAAAPVKASPEGVISTRWKPKTYGVNDGDKITYRVTLRDDTDLKFTQDIEQTFLYKSRWNQPLVQGALLGSGLLAGYAILSLTLLWLSPLALLWVHRHIPFQDVVEQATGKGFGILASSLLSITGLPALVRHPRTRRAWQAQYRAGRAKLSDLPSGLRASYVEDAGCLDAWVERRAAAAREALSRIEAVHQRRIYIELPVRVGPREDNRHLPEPLQPALRELLSAPCAVLTILGEGGTGKSTLACQLARWSIADDPAFGLAPHRMIPVLLEEETTDLLGSVTGQLRSMVGEEEVDPDVVLSLLRSKRLLVIVDSLSECTPATQSHVESIHRSTPVNALIVTARRPPDFGPVPVVELWPEKITPEKLVYFLLEYLRRTGNDGLFPGRQGVQLAVHLLGVVERGGQGVEVTPLLIKLFVEQAIALRRAGEPLERLPTSTAETILESIRHTNPPNQQMPNWVDSDTLIRAARVLARCSLEWDFVPRDFYRDRAEAELAREGIRPEKADVVARLADNGILQERNTGGTRFLRFVLDPVAEYLAALSWLDLLRNDRPRWEEWLSGLHSTPGYPERVSGFLIALQDCILTYREDFQIPIDLPGSQLSVPGQGGTGETART